MVQHFRLIEKDVSKPTAENHTKKRAAGDEITDSLRSKISVTPFGQHAQQRIAGAEGEHIRQTIPAWSDVFRKMENEWIKVVQVVSQHCCGFSVMLANAATQRSAVSVARQIARLRRGGMPSVASHYLGTRRSSSLPIARRLERCLRNSPACFVWTSA